MKTTSAVLALLLLASPLLAAMGTSSSYSVSKDFTIGSYSSSKFYWGKDSTATRTKFLVAIGSFTAPSTTTPYCLAVGIPASGVTTNVWTGADIGLYPITATVATAGTAPTWAVGAPLDNSCTGTSPAKACKTVAAESGTSDWGFVTGASTDADKIGLTGTTLSIEGARTTAATTATVDLPITSSSTSVLIGWIADECPDVSTDFDFGASTIITGLGDPTSTSSSGSGSSFGALTYLSWVALLISYALLN